MRPELTRAGEALWELAPTYKDGMNVPVRIYATPGLLQAMDEGVFEQAANVACLPGIVGHSYCMPDGHRGYGFPIGGVAAFDAADGVISPGGVGYDINCGCRLMTMNTPAEEIRPRMRDLIEGLHRDIPTGVGRSGPVKLKARDLRRVLADGAAWAVDQGFGQAVDLEHTEDGGALAGADPDALSDRALERGRPQLGTLGSGNHFLEIGMVDEIYDSRTARVFGLFEGQAVCMIHSGSRGLGHQVCDDFLRLMPRAASEAGISVPDRQLACAPLESSAGRQYLAAMAAAANYAWANRQIIMHLARESIMKTLGMTPRDLGLHLLYDVAHNIAKMEKHTVDGRERTVCVHRKGATRAYPAGRRELPDAFRKSGQPVLIPGDMGRASFVLAAAAGAMEESFASCCHGAGRMLSRSAAKKAAKGRALARELDDAGVVVRTEARRTLAEEMPEAYKDVSRVVDVVHGAGLATKTARLRPLGVIKG
jgi:tRNA-splicing ligase RtcB